MPPQQGEGCCVSGSALWIGGERGRPAEKDRNGGRERERERKRWGREDKQSEGARDNGMTERQREKERNEREGKQERRHSGEMG